MRHYVDENQSHWAKYFRSLTCAYKSKTNCSNKVSTFCCILHRHPIGPTIIYSRSPLLSDVTRQAKREKMRQKLLLRFSAMSNGAEKSTQDVQERKNDTPSDRQSLHQPSQLERNFFVYTTPVNAKTQAKKQAVTTKSRSSWKKTVPDKVLSSTSITVKIDEKGVPNTVSIVRVSTAPHVELVKPHCLSLLKAPSGGDWMSCGTCDALHARATRLYEVIGPGNSEGRSPYESHTISGHYAYTEALQSTVPVLRVMTI